MLYLIVAVLLFGLVHPASKIILDTGISLSYFCVLYIIIRLVILLPFLVTQKKLNLNYKKLFLLFCLGGFGAGVQFFEFKAISLGLNPGVVTFLVFSYPIWIIVAGLFANKKSKSTYINILKVVCGILGIYLICIGGVNVFGESSLTAVSAPIIASVFMASWIGLSNYLSKNNISSVTLSFFCDAFSLVILVLTLKGSLISEWQNALVWLESTKHLTLIVGYSIFVGLIPNMLFYLGNKKVPVLSVGLIMTLEPVLSVLYSSLIWPEKLGISFLAGALLILTANIKFK